MKRTLLPGLLLAMLVLFPAFQTPTRQQLIREAIDEKIKTFRERAAEECQNRVLTRASEIVDSLMIEEARRRKDTIPKPPRPDKPPSPEVKLGKDSSEVKPFLRKDTVGGE
jgi:hypothetical protein